MRPAGRPHPLPLSPGTVRSMVAGERSVAAALVGNVVPEPSTLTFAILAGRAPLGTHYRGLIVVTAGASQYAPCGPHTQ
jgi:hypothetical protein